MRRRDFLPALAAGTVAMAQTPAPPKAKGKLKQTVTGGVFARATSDCRDTARRSSCRTLSFETSIRSSRRRLP